MQEMDSETQAHEEGARSSGNGPAAGAAQPRPLGKVRRIVACVLIIVLASAVFYSLRGFRRRGGDTDFAQTIARRRFSVFYVRSPLTVYLHQAAYHFIFRPLGRSPAEAVGFCSAVGGGIFVAALAAISRNALFLLFNLSAPLMFIFMGHVEHYAWVNALLVVYFLAVKRHLEQGRPLWPALVWLLLAASFHMLAVFYVPSFLFLLAERDPLTRRWRWRPSRNEAEWLLIIFIAWAAAVNAAPLLLYPAGLDNGLSRLVPLVKPIPPTHYRFTLFSLAHLKMWLYFNRESSPLGLALLILLLWTIRTRFEKFLLVATGCAFFWTWIWHPDRGPRDWDLFANLALPMNILVGLLLARQANRLLKRGESNG